MFEYSTVTIGCEIKSCERRTGWLIQVVIPDMRELAEWGRVAIRQLFGFMDLSTTLPVAVG